MKSFIFIFLIAINIHGNNVAVYTFHKENETLKVKADIEAEDFLKAINLKTADVNQSQIKSYFNKHFSCKINGETARLKVASYIINEEHLTVNFVVKGQFSTIKKIQIKNTSLLEVNEDQANIIQLRFNNMQRDFLINLEKPSLTITL